jgi:hypothetical protein
MTATTASGSAMLREAAYQADGLKSLPPLKPESEKPALMKALKAVMSAQAQKALVSFGWLAIEFAPPFRLLWRMHLEDVTAAQVAGCEDSVGERADGTLAAGLR